MSVGHGRVQDKIAMVTGAGSGIGRATAVLLAEEGATVFVADIDAIAARTVAGEIRESGGAAEAIELDVTDEDAWGRVTVAVATRCGRLDILVNNAGVASVKSVSDSTLGEWRRVLAVNLDGVFLGTKHAIAAMRRGHGGSIINVASVSGITPSPGAGAYCASKAAVRLFSKVAAIECADARTGIRVNVVTPGGVKTPMWAAQSFFQDLVAQHGGVEEAFAAMAGAVPSHEFSSPQEIARTILYLASDESSPLTGVELVIAQGHAG
jgi:NAD(P)-dependent dehydrogenase (short-subunit alcohol dehydrogenase family)